MYPTVAKQRMGTPQYTTKAQLTTRLPSKYTKRQPIL